MARTSGRREDYLEAERVYREIRRSLEDHKHFSEAHRLAFRELEMRRLAMGASKSLRGRLQANVFSLEAMYRTLSDYGESVRKPLCWLGVVLLVSPLVFGWTGLDLEPGQGYFDLLGFTLRTAALIPDPPGIRMNPATQVFQVLLRVATPFLVLLLGLAVRRRFRR